MASFHLVIKIFSCCSPSSFNYRIAACSKHATRFLTCIGDRTRISHSLYVFYPSYWFPRQFCIDFIFIFQCLLVLFPSYFSELLELWLFLVQSGYPIRIYVWSSFATLRTLCDPGWSPNILHRMTFIPTQTGDLALPPSPASICLKLWKEMAAKDPLPKSASL
jgi:hypothetical protein